MGFQPPLESRWLCRVNSQVTLVSNHDLCIFCRALSLHHFPMIILDEFNHIKESPVLQPLTSPTAFSSRLSSTHRLPPSYPRPCHYQNLHHFFKKKFYLSMVDLQCCVPAPLSKSLFQASHSLGASPTPTGPSHIH